jgi:hypothetical protein
MIATHEKMGALLTSILQRWPHPVGTVDSAIFIFRPDVSMIPIIPISLRRWAQVNGRNAHTQAPVADSSAMTMVCQTRQHESSRAADGDGCKTCTVCIKAPHAEKMTLLRECPFGSILACALHRRKTRGGCSNSKGFSTYPRSGSKRFALIANGALQPASANRL